MPDLVSLSELKTYLGDAPASSDDALLTDLLEHVEALFESETGRSAVPFATGTSRTEVKDGTGSDTMFVDYPIASISAIKLGFDATDPVETLAVADRNVVTFAVGSRRIARTDGGKFGRAGAPRYVQVEYTFQTSLPEDAQMAIKSVCALAYRRRGAEEATRESVEGYTRDLARDIAAADPFWARAVAAHRRLVLV